MPSTTKNTELVPKQELDRLIEFNNQLVRSKDNLGDIIPVLRNASMGMETYTGDYKTLVQMIQSFEKLQQDTQKAVRDYGRSYDELTAAQKRYAKSKSDTAKQAAVVNEQTRQQGQLNRVAAKEILAADNSLNKYRATLARLKAEAADMDMGSEAFAKATADIAALNDKILKAEQAMGVHTRNVGNYSSAFNNLGFQIQQVARELPSLAISPGTFFLAISNNLPMLTDAYKEAIDKNKELREANKLLAADAQKQVIPAWRQALSAVLSWQTALVLGITILTTHGDKFIAWVKEIFTGRDALDAAAEAANNLNRTMAEGVVNAGKEASELDALYRIATDVTRSYDDRVEAVERLKDLYPSYFSSLSTESIMIGDAVTQYGNLKDAIVKAAQAKAQMNLITENNEKLLRLQTAEGYGEIEPLYDRLIMLREQYEQFKKDQAEALKGAEAAGVKPEEDKAYIRATSWMDTTRATITGLTEIINRRGKAIGGVLGLDGRYRRNLVSYIDEIKATNKLLVESLDPGDLRESDNEENVALGNDGVGQSFVRLSERRQAEIELEKAQAKDAAEVQKSIYENEENGYAERIKALDNYYAKRQELIDIDYDADREELDARLSTGDIDADTYSAVLAQIGYARDSALAQLQSERKEAEESVAKSVADTMIKRVKTEATSVSDELKTAVDAELVGLSEQYAKGLIDKEEYEKRKTEIAEKYRQLEFENEVQMLQKMLALENLSAEERAAITKKLADIQIEYNRRKNDEIIADNEESGNESAAIAGREAQLKKQLFDEVFNLASTLNNARLEKETERLDKESEANDEWREQELERIENLEEQGVISKEQAEARKLQIEDQAAANEEEIEKRRVEAQREAAIYSKLLSATQIGMNTATGIMKTIAEVGMPAAIPLIALTASIGAVQLANVLAEPIPEYARGTEDHPGGLAVVGDGGRHEMVVFPDGSIWRTPAVDTLVNLPEHAQVLPDYRAALNGFAPLGIEAVGTTNTVEVDMSGVLRKLEQTSEKLSESNRLARMSMSRAEKRAKLRNALLLKQDTRRKLWN